MAENIGDSKKGKKFYLDLIKRSTKSIYFYPTNELEVDLLIRNLPNKNSSGHDNVNNNLLKELKSCIVTPLTIIFNKSLTEDVFSTTMKKADVVPLHKGGTYDLKNNYRPISLLLTMSKILEELVYKRTYNYLDSNDLLLKSQYGFQANHSCEHAIGELVGNITKNYENSKHTIAVFLDLSKAFDMISHNMLLKKLDLYRIHGIAHEWFQHYLSNRQMRVKCKSGNPPETCYSTYCRLEYGALQGSCLGPLLFMIFVNDLSLNLEHVDCILFADNTTIYFGHKNMTYLEWCIMEDLENISDWFKANFLTLNLSKTVAMLFSPKKNPTPPVIKFSETVILFVEKTKFLGIWIDSKLSWNAHVNSLTLKLK